MRIKRIEIIGFKSFCDRAVINIDAPITAVVGPNGCGKSNIVDAIRWCMGEQSAKHLRGKAMEDVIFNGSETRGPASMAEVSLTFDDVGFSQETLNLALQSDDAVAERTLAGIAPEEGEATSESEAAAVASGEVDAAAQAPSSAAVAPAVFMDAEGNAIPSATEQVAALLSDQPPEIDFAAFTEVTITRRLFRDGTSQYYINKTLCRLRDITDFFLGTGIGTKAYAIIEQGRIGQIVSSRPQDRRLIIEEAAGITKFKSKKKAAEKKLEQTRQNLLRVSDIVAELEKRMGTLRRQAQKAERYRKYKTELRDIELWKAAHRYLELRGEATAIGNRTTDVRDELAASRTDWQTKDAHAVAERGELAIEERRLLGVQEGVYELDNRIRLAESKIGFERREAEDLLGRSVAAQNELAELLRQRQVAVDELAGREAELEVLLTAGEGDSADVMRWEASAGEVRQMIANAQGQLEEARAAVAKYAAEIATAEAQLDAMRRRREDANARIAALAEEAEVCQARAAELERDMARSEEALGGLRQTKLDVGNQSEHFLARKELLTEEVARGEVEVDTLRGEVQRRTSRLQSLQEIADRFEGLARGTQAVMQRPADDPHLHHGQIVGLVADVVRAPAHLEVAVEAALGDRIGGVVVADAAAGAAAVAFLKANQSGRSAFVPMAGDLRDESEAAYADALRAVGDAGVLGKMSTLVEFADGFATVGQRLFREMVVTDTLDRALALHAAGATCTIVTIEGDVVEAGGVVAGGARDAVGAGILAQKREIRQLTETLETMHGDLADATARLVTAKTELKQVVAAIDGLRASAHQSDLAIMSHEKDCLRLRGELDRVRDRGGYVAREHAEITERMAGWADEDSVLLQRQAHAEAQRVLAQTAQQDLIERAETLRLEFEELQGQVTNAKIRAAQVAEKRAGLEAAVVRLTTTVAELSARMQRLESESADAVARADVLRAQCEELQQELTVLRGKRDDDALALDEGRRNYEERLQALTVEELQVRELRTAVDRLTTELSQLELRVGQAGMNLQLLESGIFDRYQVELVEVVPDFHERALISETEEARGAELKDLLDRMGSDINLTAIDEFAEVSARFDFLTAQQNDLERAVDQLQKAIDKINKTSRKLFKDTYTAVNTTFKNVFPRLFRGGQAFLSLTGGEDTDLLEAGIEIMAQPPGKKNSTVDQLSGGEKALTAVALVFSIFLIKPSPFCILDEVDAPLDEANVDRYNEMVREMTDRSQFIVISHNKRTMESADNLYGVTMQEPGSSKLVTVNLSKLGQKAA